VEIKNDGMKRIVKLIVVFLVGFLNQAYAQVEQDSPADSPILSFIKFEKSDTLADLNASLGGVKEIEIAAETKIPEGITISKEGIISTKAGAEFNKGIYLFELKAIGGAGEVYIVNIKLDFSRDYPMIIVNSDKIDMATGLRKDGMIWVVVVVSLVLFGAIIVYLFLLDKKVSKS
jgi:hypothetical protein